MGLFESWLHYPCSLGWGLVRHSAIVGWLNIHGMASLAQKPTGTVYSADEEICGYMT